MDLEKLNSQLVECRLCPRLAAWREEVAHVKRKAYLDWDYWGKPVPGFGDPKARVMVVGLAPGAHGSNRTGRMFTGDASGDFLYPALYRAGFASQPNSTSVADGLVLHNLYITAVARCAPPGNKPTPEEIRNCLPYLEREIELVRPSIFVALGRIAFDALLCLLTTEDGRPTTNDRLPSSVVRRSSFEFSHGASYHLGNHDGSSHWLVASYHPSRQNTQTGRLTAEMFDPIWMKVRELTNG
jgi:uracil-DNA glycosylase family 4